jgi:peptidoglycan/LPS O-acetylase OafA/YrhL
MKKYYPALTGLRAISALMVFFFHATLHSPSDGRPFLVKWAVRLAQQGSMGVGIFFVLSGFLITLRYADSVELKKSWFRQYFQNRFARVYPVYFLLTVLTFVVMVVRPQYDWDEWSSAFRWPDKLAAIGLNLTLTRAYFQDMQYLGVVTAWSLTVEETYYVCAPFLLLSLRRTRWGLVLGPVLLLAVGALLVGLCAYWHPRYGLLASIEFMLFHTFFGRSLEFFVGIGLAWWLMRGKVRGRGGLVTALGVAGIVGCILLHAAMQHSSGIPYPVLLYGGIAVSNFLMPFPVALLLLGLVTERTWLQRVLQTKPFDVLGKSSYVFYLIHIGVIDTFFYQNVSANLFARLASTTLLSIGIYYGIEKPLQQRLRAKPWRREVPASPQLA